MAASLMAAGQVDAVIVGADRVTRSGDFANKIGTYALAVLAHAHHLPFYVAIPHSTIDRHLHTGEEIAIEFRGEDEVCRYGGHARRARAGERMESRVRCNAGWTGLRVHHRAGHTYAAILLVRLCSLLVLVLVLVLCSRISVYADSNTRTSKSPRTIN